MSLGVALSNAVSALRLNQTALSVLSNNMANVNTDGYSRKIINQSAVYVEGNGNGVRIDDIVRKVDTYLQRSVMSQGSVTQAAGVVTTYYDRLQVLLGAPGASNSLDEYMTGFFNTLDQMADQPDRTSYRSNMVNSANTLATQVSGLANEMESLRFQADSDISGAVTEVNSTLKKLFDLNSAIARASAVGQSTAGLLDERDMALRNLSSNLDINTFYEANGTVGVTSGNGVPLVDGVLHQLRYAPVPSVANLISDQRINALEVIAIDINGNQTGNASTLVSGGKLGEIKSGLTGGKIQGLVELRDKLIPDVLNQLDMLASRLRDSMNALHNNGSGWPPATSLTGTRDVYASTQYNWTGSVRIAVLQSDGQPVAAQYADEAYTGIRPLTLDLSKLNSTGQDGKFSVQTLVDEINNHFKAPTIKAQLGNLNNIELISNTSKLPSGGISLFNFDLELDNISKLSSSVFVTGMTVKDSNGATLPNTQTEGAPSLAVDPATAYTTYVGTGQVDISLFSIEGLAVGDKIYLNTPGIADANGITAAEMSGYFTIDAINGTSISITTTGTAASGGTVPDASGTTLMAAYSKSLPGTTSRGTGTLQADLSGNVNSAYYDITVDVGVLDADGNMSTSQITYRVKNNETNLYNDRYFASTANGNGTLELPLSTQPSLRAILVDANGNELAKANGVYVDQPGYLKIVGGSADYVVAIDEMNSQQLGDASALPSVPGTGWGLSHFFGLNDFFDSNDPIEGGDTLRNSAVNLSVQQRLLDNPNLVSSGKLTLQAQPSNSAEAAQYTYVRYSGDNSAVQAMAALSSATVNFAAAGGLPNTTLSLQSYTSEMLGYLSSLTSAAQETSDNAQLLYQGFKERNDAISAVNLDEELANTIIFQNSYAASARIVTVVNEMFKALIDAA